MCRLSALAVFVDSDPFRGVLRLKRFPWLLNPKVRLSVGHQQLQLGRFWPVSWSITQFWGSQSGFHDL